MKVTLIAAQNNNGLIATSVDDTLKWVPKEDQKNFKKLTMEIGTMVFGSNTFRAMPLLKGRRSIVLTSRPETLKQWNPEKASWYKKYHEANKGFIPLADNLWSWTPNHANPEELLKDYENYFNNDRLAICGGSFLYNLFAGVMTESIITTVTDSTFQQGISLFSEETKELLRDRPILSVTKEDFLPNAYIETTKYA